MKKRIALLIACIISICTLTVSVNAVTPKAVVLLKDGVSIGEYDTIQDASNAVKSTTVTVSTVFTIQVNPDLYSSSEDPVLYQEENKNIILTSSDPAKNVAFSGHYITVDGMFRSEEPETLEISHFQFSGTASKGYIYFPEKSSYSNGTFYSYPHNITVSDCVFNGDGVIAINTKSDLSNLTVKNCTGAATMYSLLNGGVNGLTVDGCDLNGWHRGLNVYGKGPYTITNSRIITEKYCIRNGQSGNTGSEHDETLTIENCVLHSTSEDGALILRGKDALRTVNISESSLTADNGLPAIDIQNYALTEVTANDCYWGDSGLSDSQIKIAENNESTITRDTFYIQQAYDGTWTDKLVLSNPAPEEETPVQASAETWCVTFLDCKGETVSVQWVETGKDAAVPEGYQYSVSDYTNISSHRDISPISCSVSGYTVPYTADRTE